MFPERAILSSSEETEADIDEEVPAAQPSELAFSEHGDDALLHNVRPRKFWISHRVSKI